MLNEIVCPQHPIVFERDSRLGATMREECFVQHASKSLGVQLPALEAGRKAHCPLAGEAVGLRLLPSAVGCVVGPELGRAQVVLYRANLPHAWGKLLAPSARALGRHGRVSQVWGSGRSPL